jgi:PA domain-containing protein
VALANKLAGADLAPGPNNTSADDIQAIFNANLGNVGCLTGVGFYYGLDANHGTQIDLVTVLLHEFGHGLGFANFVTEASGSQPLGLTDIFSIYTFDTQTGLHWSQMTTNAQRQASAINSNRVVWDGINVTAAAPSVLQLGTPLLTVNTPASLGTMRIGAAAFGPAITSPGTTGNLVLALDPADGAGPTTTDACSPITNAAAVAGNIALVDRGTCGFIVKVKNAQNAGAKAVIIVNNVAGPPMALGGTDDTITIPSVMVRQDDGNRLFEASVSQGPAPTPTPTKTPGGGPGPTATPTRTPTPRPPTPTPTPSSQPPSSSPATLDPEASTEPPSTCVENGTTLCLENDRFRVRARYTTRAGASGDGHGVALTGDSGYFWFFDPDNVEVVLKVKNACAAPFDHYWVFAAGLTDLDVVIQVADTQTGHVLTYHNPQQRAFPPVQDTDAFQTCP